jgi:photosystem II stability/assembly factor-like uncharacterized protein
MYWIIKSLKKRFLSPVLLAAVGLVLLLPYLTLSPAKAQPSSALDQSTDEPRTEEPYLRRQWFYEQRAYPNERIPQGAMHRAREYLKQAISRQELTAAPPVGGNIWEQIGPARVVGGKFPSASPYSGRVRSIAVQSSSIIYIGAASGGVWKTTNGGTSWTPLTDDQPSLAMGSVAIDPSNSAVIYAGTGEYRGSGGYGAGLLKSADSGNNWTHIPGPWDTLQFGGLIQKVVVITGPVASNPNDDTVLIAGNGGLFRSTQGGSDFIASSTPVLGGDISDVVVDPTNSNILYAARHSVGVYRSTDRGQTWDADLSSPGVVDPIWRPSTTNPNCDYLRGALAIAPTNTNILYAAFESPWPPPGDCDSAGKVFRTTNAQAATPTFTQLTTPRWQTGSWAGIDWCRAQCWYNLALIVQPIDPDGAGPLNPQDIVYVGGVGLFRSTDGGSTWTGLGEPGELDDPPSNARGIHVDQHTFAFDTSGALYVGNDGGVYKHPSAATATTFDLSWINLNTNLATIQFYPGVSVHPSSVEPGKPLALGGNQDNGVVKYTGSLQWDALPGEAAGDGAFTAIDFTNPDNVWYVSTQNLGISKTTDGGTSFFDATTGLALSRVHFIAPFVMCPDNAQVLIASDDWGVYRTNNGASSWFDNSPNLANTSPTALAFAPGSGCNTYFAGFPSGAGRLFRTMTGGGTTSADWDDITGNLPNRWVKDIAVHPTNANIVYVSFSGWCGNNASCPANQGHVWRTTNALATPATAVTWTDLTGGKGLPNVPVNAIVLDPADPQILYIGTDLGLYRSLDGGTTWELFNNGLPNVIVKDLVLNGDTGVLVAATHGRSMFRLTGAIYVDASWTGYEDGTVQFPYNTVSEGVSAVRIGGQLWLKAGTYIGTGNVPITISKAMAIRSYEGTAVIGQ